MSRFIMPSLRPSAGVGAVLATVSQSAIIAVIADSTGAGQRTGGDNTQATTSWPSQFCDLLVAAGYRATDDSWFGDRGCFGAAQSPAATGAANYAAGDGRVSFTGAWGPGSDLIAGGNNFGASAAGSMIITPRRAVKKPQIRWRDGAAGRNFSALFDGTTTQVNSTGSTGTQYALTSLTAATAGIKPLTMTWNGTGNVTIASVIMYDDTNGMPIQIYNWSISGITSTALLNATATPRTRPQQYGDYAPDVAIIEGGIINDWRTSIAVATSKANLTTLVTTMKAAKGGTCKPILMTPVFDNSNTGNAAIQDQYVTAMKEVATEQNVPLIDVRPTFQSWAYANAQGWMSDTVHPTAAGYAVIAGLVNNAIRVA